MCVQVLYGVFLYQGVSSLAGVEFVERMALLVTPAKYQPDLMFLRHVRISRIHMFTAIQIFAIAAMWIIKSIQAASILFPLLILGSCFVRKGTACRSARSSLLSPLHSTTVHSDSRMSDPIRSDPVIAHPDDPGHTCLQGWTGCSRNRSSGGSTT